MPKERTARVAFNRGLMSLLGLGRIDLERYAMAAEVMTNWMSRVLGSMMLRPGWQYISSTLNNAKAKTLDFVFSTDDTAQLEVTEGAIRVRIDDVLITRPSVVAATTNGGFDSNLTGWADADEAGATSDWLTGGYMSLVGTGTNAAIRTQTLTVVAGTEHALRVIVFRGTVEFRVGSTSGADDYVSETTLGVGTHSLAFTPTGTSAFIRVQNRKIAASLVDSIQVESAGTLELPAPWQEEDLPYIRKTQSGDIIYVACAGFQQRKIERRSARSWSIVLYQPENGPFRVPNTGPITITPSALTGDVTLTASASLFRSTHVGALFKLTSTGQVVTASLTGADQFTDPIRVNGVGGQRAFSVLVTGTWVATVTLQYSVAEPGSWVDVATYTTNQAISFNDELDNQILYYRIGIKSGDYTSGTAVATLSFSSGSATGVARITAYSSETSVTAAVLDALGGTTATSDWAEGAWSDRRGWPSAVALHEGRLWWFGTKTYGSVSDDYENFDDTTEGDSGPIQRTVGEGPIESIHWGLSLARLMLGTAANSANIQPVRIDGNNPISARSSSLDEPLTPTNFNLRYASTRGVFIDRSRQRVYELAFDVNSSDFKDDDLTLLVPDLNDAGITHVAIQHKPDIRLHCVREDGTVGVLVFDRAENVICWLEIETDGDVEDVSVLPGTGEDQVYYVVKRTIDGSTVRYLEKWAMESECTGRPGARHADAHLIYSGSPTTTITGLSHLEGEEVVVWGWHTGTPFEDQDGNAIGRDFGTFTVASGQITGLSAAVTDACVGLAYTAQWKSLKNAFGAALGTPLNQTQRIDKLGLLLLNTHCQGIRCGNDFDYLDDLPLADLPESSVDTPDTNHVFASYDQDMFEFNDTWSTDSRLCLEAAAPRPCTVLAASISITTNG